MPVNRVGSHVPASPASPQDETPKKVETSETKPTKDAESTAAASSLAADAKGIIDSAADFLRNKLLKNQEERKSDQTDVHGPNPHSTDPVHPPVPHPVHPAHPDIPPVPHPPVHPDIVVSTDTPNVLINSKPAVKMSDKKD